MRRWMRSRSRTLGVLSVGLLLTMSASAAGVNAMPWLGAGSAGADGARLATMAVGGLGDYVTSPEPGAIALAGLGLLLMFLRRGGGVAPDA